MADLSDKKRYNYMENVLKRINQDYISLPDSEVKRNNRILDEILTKITNKMKQKDVLFDTMYTTVFYGGSYYDGLRVGRPEEFDLDLLLELPKIAMPTLTIANIPGFLHVELKELTRFRKQPEASTRYKNFETLLDDKGYLITKYVICWMESVLSKTLNDFEKSGSEYIITTSMGKFFAKFTKGGPALTLKVRGDNFKMDVDLVPCFVFDQNAWPQSPYRRNPVAEKPRFFIVPKVPKTDNLGIVGRYWRLSFQEQERILISRYSRLKPTLKLLKKLRDEQNHCSIASYYIKTVFLWEVTKLDGSFWDNSLSYVFMEMLKKYIIYLDNGKIPYFWNERNNLIDKINASTLENIKNKLKRILTDIEKKPGDAFVVAKYLGCDDVERLRNEVDIGRKHLNRMMSNLNVK